MKSMTNLDHIMQIISATEIINQHSFLIDKVKHNTEHKKPYREWSFPDEAFGSNPGNNYQDTSSLRNHLSDIIYTQFYSIGGASNQINSINPEIIPGYIQRQQEFIAALSEANQNKIDTDPYWTVTRFVGAQAVIQKNEFIKYLKAGMYEMAEPNGTLEVGAQVHLKEPIEDASMQPVFFYIFGAATLQDRIETLRFYFNMSADGANQLVFHLSNILNYYLIPFSFKCLNEAGWYNRVDNAVLYIDKRFHNVIGDIIQLIYDEVSPWINSPTPLFTKQLAPGLGFAEDPGHGHSFGDTRCKIIAQLILDGHSDEKKLNRRQVKAAFIKKGFNVEKLHLNPFSSMTYPYQINQSQT